MNYRTYQQFRTYCCDDLRDYLDLPGYDAMRKLWGKLNGQVGLIQREQQIAISLHQCSDLTPRERAAAELLAVISNHRAIAWQREPEPPNGNEPASPLEKIEADAMANQTRDAVKRYATFLPEPERAVLLADCEAAPETETDAAYASAAKGDAGDEIPGKMPTTTIGRLAIKAAWQIEGGTGKRATAKQVIETLQSWVDHKDNPDAVAELTDKIPNGVKWVTSAGKVKNYNVEACQKTLETWNKNRA